MGYGITPTGQFDEDVLLHVRATCACGAPLNRDDTLYEPAGTVSLTRLAELSILAADLARCLCGAWNGRTGDSHACYRIPGAGPWLVATSRIEQRPRAVTLTARNRPPADTTHDTVITELPNAELETASRLGQPASVRAAWAEAMFALNLGATERSFPAGAGVRCVATTTPDNHDGQLDLAVTRLPDANPADWLDEQLADDLETGRAHCLVHIDADAVQREIEAEAARVGLQPHPGARRQVKLRLPDGDYTIALNTDRLLARAVGSGRLLRLQAGHSLQRARRRLLNLTAAAHDIVQRLNPDSAQPHADEHTLTMSFPAADLHVDVAAYADAPIHERETMLTHWQEQAA